MTFNEKLSFLVKTFNSNNSKLAKAINVDPSLVSKWRNGKRTLSADSSYIELIADYFLNIDLLQQQKDILTNLLRQFNSNISICSRIQLKKHLIEWLFAAEDGYNKKETRQYNSNSYQNYDINSVLSKLNNLTYDYSDRVDPDIQTPYKIPIKKGEAGCFEAFRGNEGKRQGALNIMSMALASDKPVELLLCDESNMDWLLEDQKFFTSFGNVLKQLINKGHKIVIVHNVNRELPQIMAIMDFWLPLHLTGCVEAYFSPRYVNGVNSKTICIVRNTAVAISLNSEIDTGSTNVFLSENQLLVKLTEDLFMSYLVKCRLLVKVYRSKNIDEYYNEVIDMEDKLGSLYALRNRLTSLAIPFDVYSRLLDTLPLTPLGKKERLDFHMKRVENFKKKIKYYKHVEIINVDIFEKSCFEDVLKFDGLDFLVADAVKCRPDDFVAYMMNLIHFLKEYKNYEILLIKFNNVIQQNRVSITVKTDSTAIVSSCDINGSNSVIIVTNQDHIVEGVKQYLLNLIESIPVTKLSKDSVISKLNESVAAIKEWNDSEG